MTRPGIDVEEGRVDERAEKAAYRRKESLNLEHVALAVAVGHPCCPIKSHGGAKGVIFTGTATNRKGSPINGAPGHVARTLFSLLFLQTSRRLGTRLLGSLLGLPPSPSSCCPHHQHPANSRLSFPRPWRCGRGEPRYTPDMRDAPLPALT